MVKKEKEKPSVEDLLMREVDKVGTRHIHVNTHMYTHERTNTYTQTQEREGTRSHHPQQWGLEKTHGGTPSTFTYRRLIPSCSCTPFPPPPPTTSLPHLHVP